MQCPRCGEWAVCVIRPGTRTCLNCGWTRPVEWAEEPVAPKAQGDEGRPTCGVPSQHDLPPWKKCVGPPERPFGPFEDDPAWLKHWGDNTWWYASTPEQRNKRGESS